MKAVIYTRTSKDEVKDPRMSNATQEYICRERAVKENDEIVQVYSDINRSGDSEKLKKRKQFLKLIEEVKKLEIKRVYFLDLSRFARSAVDQGLFIRELARAGIDIMPINDSKEKLSMQIKGIFNEQLIDVSRQRAESEHHARLSQGMPVSRSPIGYKINAKTHKWVIDERKAIIVKSIFNLKLHGSTVKEIAIKTGFPEISIKRILNNKSYIGLYIYRGKELGQFHDPIIEKEVFEKCQT